MCNGWDVVCGGKEAVGGAIADFANDQLQNLVDSIVETVGTAVQAMATVWVMIPTPNLTQSEGEVTTVGNSASAATGSEGFATILGYVVWISLAICIMSVLAGGAMLALNHRRGEGSAHMGRLGIVLVAVMLISAASAIVAGLIPAIGTSGGSGPVAYLQDSLWWYVAGFAVLSVIVAGLRMAWTQRMQPGKELLQSLLTLVVVSSAGLTAVGLAVAAADGFSVWILDGAADGDFKANITATLGVASSSGIGLIAMLILGTITILMSYVQVFLMVIRGGMLVILAGILPITAAFTNTETGRAWFKKSIGWIVAFILYKPAAAIVYAAAFKLTGSNLFVEDSTGLVKMLTGLALMAMALVALPALMKFVAPMVSQTGGGGGAAIAMAAAGGAALGEVASGAMKKLSSNTGSSASGGGGGGGDDASGSKKTASPSPSPSSTGGGGGGGGATSGAAAAGKAASTGGGGAAAAGPVGIGLAAAQKAGETGAKAAAAAKSATEDAAGGGPTGN
ncbi:hypothetical protein [Cryobacterium zongtaii]|uniref:hypothetical protein n=1 Tax=Cryobacterium zongtaii TaxID=1259217 RepID=UPI001056FA91|nr:hypothetical protein [Cryobacterium zongtaii]